MKIVISLITLLASFFYLSPALAGDAEAGKAKAAVCTACHGAQGVSQNAEWPNLAGQNEIYLVRQITAFRDGVRKNALMAPMVNGLSDEDINNLAAYYSSLETPEPHNVASDAVGRNQISTCVSCHGLLGKTVASEWPHLAGQQPVYIANQLKAFRDGTRVNPVMSQMAAPLSDEDAEAIGKYFYSLDK